jgi:surfeit locus 1 family protein
VWAQTNQPALQLTPESLSADLANMEYREVVVSGEYDFSQEVALRNQAWNDHYGVHLLTPLRIAGTDQYVLADRGWIPGDDFDPAPGARQDWSKYAEPGIVEVRGIIRLPQSRADFGRIADPTPAPGGRLEAWNLVNVTQIGQQMPYPLLPVYIQQAPDPAWTSMPYRSQPELELTEGPHLGYAIQWFTFATILGLGYPFYVRREEQKLVVSSR